eukprot:TRINITY_DN21457_c0_g1_i2.p1 TRINITY_DN21457_c0_g1~~TRINITY_DN21457_c0_g1_i2.p1  ORF type:complete len:394 (+),score=54.83 TRINITY_DN21457_c0_g1_i2:247-1428(+)
MLASTVKSFIVVRLEKEGALTPKNSLLGSMAYAICALSVGPLLVHNLTDDVTEKGTYMSDLAKLAKKSIPMTMNWAVKDCVPAVLNCTGMEFVDEFGMAVGLTVAVSIMTISISRYQGERSLERDSSGAVKERLCDRYLQLPACFTVAIAFAWNLVSVWVIKKAQHPVADRPTLVFAIQVVYFILVASVITWATAQWTAYKKNRSADSDGEKGLSNIFANGNVPEQFHDIGRHVAEMEETMASIFVTSLAYVYGWALSNTGNAFFFTLMMGYTGPGTASYQANISYALMLSVVSQQWVSSLQAEERKSDYGSALQGLLVNSASLALGAAWSAYFHSQLAFYLQHDMKESQKPLAQMLALVVFWTGAVSLYHNVLQHSKVLERTRREELEAHTY